MRRILSVITKLMLVSFAITIVSCSNDDEPKIPSDAIALNMITGDAGTTIGGSDVYINQSLNFTTSYCAIADLGKRSGFDNNPNLSQVAQEVAVSPGNFYQITSLEDIRTVAGARAYPADGTYYNVYVDSWIYDKDNEIVGAKISYAECYPKIKQLPEWDSNIDVKWNDEAYFYTATYSFPKGYNIDERVVVYDTYGYVDTLNQFKWEINGTKITFSYPSHMSYPLPLKAAVLVRYESVYTRVLFTFEDSY